MQEEDRVNRNIIALHEEPNDERFAGTKMYCQGGYRTHTHMFPNTLPNGSLRARCLRCDTPLNIIKRGNVIKITTL